MALLKVGCSMRDEIYICVSYRIDEPEYLIDYVIPYCQGDIRKVNVFFC